MTGGFERGMRGLVALLCLAMLLPVVSLVIAAGEARQQLGVILGDQALPLALSSLGLAAAVTITAAFIALPLALISVSDLPGLRLWRALFALPLAVPSYIGALALIACFGVGGLAGGLGLPLPNIKGFFGAWLCLSLLTYPYLYLPLRGALLKADPALIEAARSLGRGPGAALLHGLAPALRPALISGGFLVALYTLSDFGAVSLLQYEAFTAILYDQFESTFDRGRTAVLALVFLALTLAVFALEAWLRRSRARAAAARARVVRPLRLRLGRWRWPALAFSATVLTLALAAPLLTLALWFIRGLRAGEGAGALWGPAASSLLASALAAAAATLAALPIAALSARTSSALARFGERLSHLGFALPGVVLALALVFFAARAPFGIYQSLALLIFAYALRFLPQSVGATRTAFAQSPPALEEAARSLGRGPWGAFRAVSLPLIAPGLRAGAILVFLTTMKELPITMILGPLDFDTLATEVWSATEEGLFARASAPALLLLLLAAAPMLLIEPSAREGS